MGKLFRIIFLLLMLGGKIVFSQELYPIKFELTTPIETASVHVVGEFNHWSSTANPLIYSGETDIWETIVNLEPGSYEYRFLINGLNWIKDPKNPHWCGKNSNSIKYVRTAKEPMLINLRPETGSILSESVLRIQAEYLDGVEKNGLDVEASKILIDDSSIYFDYLPEKNLIRAHSAKLADGEHRIIIEAVDMKGNKALPLNSIVLINSKNEPPQVEAGSTIITGVGENVTLNSGVYFDPDGEPLRQYRWRIISRPANSKLKLVNDKTPFPSFIPDQAGRYIFRLKISDGNDFSLEDSVDVYAFIKKKYPTEFQFADSSFTRIYESSVDCVYVAGEFNHWSANASPMNDFNQDGLWSVWIDLEPGEYEYKFVVNGQHWIPDPANQQKVADGWNGFNSVKSVTLNLAPNIEVQASFRPGKIFFDASSSYSKIGKEIAFNWYQDINNPERFQMAGNEQLTIPMPKKNGVYYYYVVGSDGFGSSAQKTFALKVKDRQVQVQNFTESPDWANDAIIYEIFVRQFTPEGNLKGVISKIPYLKSLGINCIWLMPIFESVTENGYGVTDFYRVNPQFGTADDLKALIKTAHHAGIKIVLDFIANHTSDQHPYFMSAFQNPYSVYRNWYCWFNPEEERGFYQYKFHNDWDQLPNLNFENPQVRKYIIDVAEHWANWGIDGYRCDVAWGVPHDFWKLFRRRLKNINPEFLLLNETLPRSPKYHDNEFDMSYDTDFYGNLLDVFNGRKPVAAIDYGLQKTSLNYPPQTLNLRYIENHDMDRFISQFGVSKTKLAATLLFTIPGSPMILYGQEIGLREKLAPMDWSIIGDNFYKFYQQLITLRRNHGSLRRGKMDKVPTNFEDKIYAYARYDDNERFLIILNLANEPLDCQLLLINSLQFKKRKIDLMEVLTGDRKEINLLLNNKIKLMVQPETSYIFKIL